MAELQFADLEMNECAVCCEQFVSPRILPCKHTFCLPCVERLTRDDVIRCPTCNLDHAASDVMPDFRLDQFLEVFSQNGLQSETETKEEEGGFPGVKDVCQLCGKDVFTMWCLQCQQWMCDRCVVPHSRANVSRHHQYESVSEKARLLHEELVSELPSVLGAGEAQYGATAAEFLRRSLLELNENRHSCIAAVEALREHSLFAIETWFNEFHAHVEAKFHADVTRLEAEVTRSDDFRSDCLSIEKMVTNGQSRASYISQCQTALGSIRKWKKLLQEGQSELGGAMYVKRLFNEMGIASLEPALKDCLRKTVFGSLTDFDVADSRNQIREHKSELSNFEPSKSTCFKTDKLEENEVLFGSSGRIRPEKGEEICASSVSSVHSLESTPEMSVGNPTPWKDALKKPPAQQASTAIKLSSKQSRSIVDFQRDLKGNFTVKRRVETKTLPNAIRLYNDRIYVALKNGMVQVFDQKLELLDTVQIPTLGNVYDVTFAGSEMIFACCANPKSKLLPGVHVVNAENGKVKRNMTLRNTTSCVYSSGNLVCFESNPPCIRIWAFDTRACTGKSTQLTHFFSTDELGFLLKRNSDVFLYNCQRHQLFLVQENASVSSEQQISSLKTGNNRYSFLSGVDEQGQLLVSDASSKLRMCVVKKGGIVSVLNLKRMNGRSPALCQTVVVNKRIYVLVRGDTSEIFLYSTV